jgi:hypothetical protein
MTLLQPDGMAERYQALLRQPLWSGVHSMTVSLRGQVPLAICRSVCRSSVGAMPTLTFWRLAPHSSGYNRGGRPIVFAPADPSRSRGRCASGASRSRGGVATHGLYGDRGPISGSGQERPMMRAAIISRGEARQRRASKFADADCLGRARSTAHIATGRRLSRLAGPACDGFARVFVPFLIDRASLRRRQFERRRDAVDVHRLVDIARLPAGAHAKRRRMRLPTRCGPSRRSRRHCRQPSKAVGSGVVRSR